MWSIKCEGATVKRIALKPTIHIYKFQKKCTSRAQKNFFRMLNRLGSTIYLSGATWRTFCHTRTQTWRIFVEAVAKTPLKRKVDIAAVDRPAKNTKVRTAEARKAVAGKSKASAKQIRKVTQESKSIILPREISIKIVIYCRGRFKASAQSHVVSLQLLSNVSHRLIPHLCTVSPSEKLPSK